MNSCVSLTLSVQASHTLDCRAEEGTDHPHQCCHVSCVLCERQSAHGGAAWASLWRKLTAKLTGGKAQKRESVPFNLTTLLTSRVPRSVTSISIMSRSEGRRGRPWGQGEASKEQLLDVTVKKCLSGDLRSDIKTQTNKQKNTKSLLSCLSRCRLCVAVVT